MLLQHFALLRSESMIGLDFADLFSVELPDEGITPCTAVIVIMRSGKTNQFSNIEYGSFIRNKDVEVCPVSALAQYLFYRFHCSNECFPDFTTNDSWYLLTLHD